MWRPLAPRNDHLDQVWQAVRIPVGSTDGRTSDPLPSARSRADSGGATRLRYAPSSHHGLTRAFVMNSPRRGVAIWHAITVGLKAGSIAAADYR